MKLPLETMSGTVVAGVILTALFALIANVMSGGYAVDIVIILVLWLGMFGLLSKPS